MYSNKLQYSNSIQNNMLQYSLSEKNPLSLTKILCYHNGSFVALVLLTLRRQNNCRLLNFVYASLFKVLQCCPKLVKMLSEC